MSHDADAGRKLRESLSDYAKKEFADQHWLPQTQAVLDCFVPDEESARIVAGIVEDCIFRYLLAAGQMMFDDCGGHSDTLDDLLDMFLKRKTRLTGRNVTHFRQVLKRAILTKNSDRPKNEVITRIRKKQNRFYCYICGNAILSNDKAIGEPHTENEHMDHVWPHSAGGGSSNDNLRRAHPECDSIKADIAVCGDTALARFAFTHLTDALSCRPRQWWPHTLETAADFNSLTDAIRAAQLRIAILRRQDFSCSRCGNEFRERGEVILRRRNDDEPWWFPNTHAICSVCSEEQ